MWYEIIVFFDCIKKFENYTENTPIYAISQITGKIINKDKTIMASTGVFYDIDELNQHVASKSPIFAITGKELFEWPEDFNDDDFFFNFTRVIA